MPTPESQPQNTRKHFFQATCGCCSSRRGFLGGALALAATAASPTRVNAQAKPQRLVDVHHHFFPTKYIAAQSQRIRDAVPGFHHVLEWVPEKSIEAMDKSGIASAAMSISPPGVWFGDIPEGRRVARECNDFGAQLVRDHPGRFALLAAIPLPDIEGSLREIEYAYDVLKADGVGLYTSYNDLKWLGHKNYAPVMDELNRRRAVVFVHPLHSACCSTLLPEPPPASIEYAFDTTRTVTDLLYSDTLTRCPDIKFIFSHGGGTIPMLADRLTNYARARPNTKTRWPKGPIYELKKLYYDTASVSNVPAFAALKAFALPTNILLGSDYPYKPPQVALKELDALDLSEKDLAMIERDNALALFPRLKA